MELPNHVKFMAIMVRSHIQSWLFYASHLTSFSIMLLVIAGPFYPIGLDSLWLDYKQ